MRTKRIEYENDTIMVDKDLEKTIEEKSKDFVNDILSNVGKEYLIPDLEQVILRNIMFAIVNRQMFEFYDVDMEDFDIDRDAED